MKPPSDAFAGVFTPVASINDTDDVVQGFVSSVSLPMCVLLCLNIQVKKTPLAQGRLNVLEGYIIWQALGDILGTIAAVKHRAEKPPVSRKTLPVRYGKAPC